MDTRLIKTLEAVGQPTVRVPLSAGGQALVLPHGGRVLGLYASGSDENFLWNNPAIRSAKNAARLFESDDWCNPGGDRTWVAPENDFFRPDYPKNVEYVQPRQLDPGAYRCETDTDGVRLTCVLDLHSYRTGEDVRLRIVKRIEPAANPFHQAQDSRGLAGLSFAGYTLRSSLQILGMVVPQSKREAPVAGALCAPSGRGAERPGYRRPTAVAMGLWHLLQMPHGGRMLVPIRSRVKPSVYFGEVPKGDMKVGERAIQYTMRGAGSHKIGITAIALTGRAGYAYRSQHAWTLVVRNFAVNPSGAYVDALPNGVCPGDAFQACSVSDPTFGQFSELEYHVPAIGGVTGLTCCEDVSQVWAFRGRLADIRRVATVLLGVAA